MNRGKKNSSAHELGSRGGGEEQRWQGLVFRDLPQQPELPRGREAVRRSWKKQLALSPRKLLGQHWEGFI